MDLSRRRGEKTIVVWRHRLALILLAVPMVGLAALGLVLTPFAALIPLLALVPGLVAMATYALATSGTGPQVPENPGRTGTGHWRGVRLGLAAAGVTAAAVSMVAGLVVVAGPAAGPLLGSAGLAAVGWAWWGRLRWRHRRAGRNDDFRGGGPVPVELGPASGTRPLVRVLDTLSTPALCGEWERSFRVLSEATDPAGREDVAELRRRYLDELERRDPDAVERWLAIDPRPAGTDPAPHLSHRAIKRRGRSTRGRRAPGTDHASGPDQAA